MDVEAAEALQALGAVQGLQGDVPLEQCWHPGRELCHDLQPLLEWKLLAAPQTPRSQLGTAGENPGVREETEGVPHQRRDRFHFIGNSWRVGH